ncbi:MAG: Crp/Fnr family transcriptional regulator [Burkholderiales bacterium]|nr:Crp/Fnr family transcriptional regulator [Burkholderiales bacterium]
MNATRRRTPRARAQQPVPVEAFIANLPLFRHLPKAERARLAAGATVRAAPRGTVLFRSGDPCEGFHVVIYGNIKLALQAPGGGERVIELMGPGQSFGEAMMFLGEPYMVSAVALVDSRLLHVASHAVFDLIDRDPRFARRMLAGLSLRLHRLVCDLEAVSLRSGTQRVAGYLLGQARAAGAGGAHVTLPARKGIVASRLSLTQEHFSRILHELCAQDLIEVAGLEIRIRDTARLRARCIR